MRLSKSKFVAGVQCPKRLYLQIHQPELAAEPDDGAEAVMSQGQEVGLMAQKAFKGGVLVEADHSELGTALRITRELVENPEVPAIFEATFEHANVLVRVDVLERCHECFRLIEVKSSTSMKEHYRYDIGIQQHVVAGAGVPLGSSYLMHLNREYVYAGGDYDLNRLFTVAEMTPDLVPADGEISQMLEQQFHMLEQPEPPAVKAGERCCYPVACEFYPHCNPELPSDHVSHLPRMRAARIETLQAVGVTSIHQIPEDFPLTELQQRACAAVKTGATWIGSELQNDLSTLEYPICFMDFETIYPALPRFEGMRPYDHIPFQWSVHRQERPGAPLSHSEFMATDRSDPRPAFVDSLLKTVEGAGSIVVYNQAFESTRLSELVHWLPPAPAKAVNDIQAKLWDLLPVIRRNVYHPAFGGSYSLKQVLPALVPDMTYDGMCIGNGEDAGIGWMRMVDDRTSADDKARIRQSLLDYCRQDTLALARLLDALRCFKCNTHGSNACVSPCASSR